jgi:hypothetical protein
MMNGKPILHARRVPIARWLPRPRDKAPDPRVSASPRLRVPLFIAMVLAIVAFVLKLYALR